MKIAIVIPLFNEEKYITNVIKGLKHFKTEIVIVDDGSIDKSKLLAEKLVNNLISHKINLGKGSAMKTGAEYAFSKGFDAVVFMDSDGQHNPKNLSNFIDMLESKKYDVVIGSRNQGRETPRDRYLGNKLASLVIKLFFGIYVSDPLCGFRAITKHAHRELKWDSSGYGVELEMLARIAKTKLNFTEVPVDSVYHDRDKGVSMLDAFGILLQVVKWRLTL